MGGNGLQIIVNLLLFPPFSMTLMHYIRGRLQQSGLCYNAKDQAILHLKAHMMMLIIESEHLQLLHVGHSTDKQFNAAEVLDCQWQDNPILGGTLGDSATWVTALGWFCSGLPCHQPLIMVPYYLLWSVIADKRSSAVTKAYTCLFVCLAIKAIHFELVSSLVVESFITAFRWSIAHRSIPKEIMSDSGTNFIATRKVCTSFSQGGF